MDNSLLAVRDINHKYIVVDKSINEICLEAGGQNLLFQIVCLQHSLQNKDMRKEVIINKHENIYPELFPLDE